jgi:hypothetical protein
MNLIHLVCYVTTRTKILFDKTVFMKKKEYSKNSFKTSSFLKKMQKIGLPEKTDYPENRGITKLFFRILSLN